MNRRQPSFWKQPRGLIVLGIGLVLLLATGWMAFSRLGPSASSSEGFTAARRIDENALVAANAESPGNAPATTSQANAVEAASGDKPPVVAAPPITGDKPADARSDVERMVEEAEAAADEAEAAADEAVREVEEALGGGEDGKRER